MGGTFVGVGGGVLVGTGVEVAGGVFVTVTVGESVGEAVAMPVGEAVNVGNGVGTKDVDVGNGVKVRKSNKPVGVTGVPSVGKRKGLGRGVEADLVRNRESVIEQRQHNTTRNNPGTRILPHCPCWRYAVFS